MRYLWIFRSIVCSVLILETTVADSSLQTTCIEPGNAKEANNTAPTNRHIEEKTSHNDNYSQEETTQLSTNLIDWIRENGGTVDDRQVLLREDVTTRNVYATDFIPKGTVLCSIPWDLVLSPLDSDEEADLCETVRVVHHELLLDDEGNSKFGPYVQMLKTLMKPHMLVPAGWSDAGKELLRSVLGDNLPPKDLDRLLNWYRYSCGGDQDATSEQAALLALAPNAPLMRTPSGTYQKVMLPFIDSYSHRNGVWTNAELFQDEQTLNLVLTATKNIRKGDVIYRSFDPDNPAGTPNLFRDHGIIEDLPQHFSFDLPSYSGHSGKDTVAFEYRQEPIEDNVDGVHVSEPEVIWVQQAGDNAWPPSARAIDFLKAELERLEALREVFDPQALHLAAVPKHERIIIWQYYSALLDALRHAPLSNTWTVTRFTLAVFEVAGVNLGQYKLSEEEVENTTNAKPFELFEDFDIGHFIEGNEGWHDILEYRRTLERPSLSFYVDKVARKRWLPSKGYPQPKHYVLNYGSELTDTDKVEDQTQALLQLLPNATDYAAKPTHHSETVGVWLVSHEVESGNSTFTTVTGLLDQDEAQAFNQETVARTLAKNIHVEARPGESWALRNVKPGVVVEERFVDLDYTNQQPMEFNIFSIWGRVWGGQMNCHRHDGWYQAGFIYRNGSFAEGTQTDEMPDYVDWPELVEVAESLSANKDMFRVDIFVGLPSDAPSLREGATKEDRLAEVKHAVSECEIFPTTSFQCEKMKQEAARLWIAGYKIGNYRTIPNTEIPKEFIETDHIDSVN